MIDQTTLGELVAEGLSTRGIAARLSVSQLQVRYYLRRYGMKTLTTRVFTSSAQTDLDIARVVPECFSVSEVCQRLGKAVTGNSFTRMQARIRLLKLDTSHFLTPGQARRKNRLGREAAMGSEIFSVYPVGVPMSLHKIRRVYLRTHPYRCECGITDSWGGRPLTLQMDHVNGDKRDNRLENLRWLCPNCHSQTSTFGAKNQKKVREKREDPSTM